MPAQQAVDRPRPACLHPTLNTMSLQGVVIKFELWTLVINFFKKLTD